MFPNKRVLFVPMIAALIVPALAILPSAGAQEGPKPEAVGLRPDAPPYAVHGPYWVGIKDYPITFEYKDGTKRESRVTIWYPALNPEGKLEPFTYPAEKRITDWAGSLFFPRTGGALLDAAPNPEGAPYPLVIYSHGGRTYRWLTPEYCEHLASWGLVVLSTDHEDAPPGGLMPPHAEISRQWDISALIDYAAQITKPDGVLAGMVDPERVGVTGYSAFTVMLAGGARRNSHEKRTWCATDEIRNSWLAPLLCGDEDARDREWSSLLGLEAPPDDLWPDVGDARVNAIVPIEGYPFEFGSEGLSQIRVPALLIFFRGAPAAIPYPLDTLDPGMAGVPQSMAIFENANHFLFLHACKGAMITPQTFPLCAEPVWDKQRAHDLIYHLATAFLLATFKGDTDAAAALAADQVAFPGITYKAQGF